MANTLSSPPKIIYKRTVFLEPFCIRNMLLHCNENPIFVFLFWEKRGLSHNFNIHVSVSNLYSPRIGLHISSSRIGRPMVGINESLIDAWIWKLGLRPRYSFYGSICFEISVFCLCSVAPSRHSILFLQKYIFTHGNCMTAAVNWELIHC